MNLRTRIEGTAHQAGLVADFGLGNAARLPPQKARDKRAEVANQYGGNFYAPVKGLPTTLKAVADFSQIVDGVALDPERNIMISECGTRWLPGQLVRALACSSGDRVKVYMPKPYYSGHLDAAKQSCGFPMQVEYGNGLSYIDALCEEDFTGKTAVVIISSVDNPTTTVLSDKDMEKAVALTEKGVYLYVDDAYRHVYRKDPIPSIFRVPGALEQNVLATITASKAWQWPGLKSGALMGNGELVDLVLQAKGHDSEGGDPASQSAFEELLLDLNYMEDTREEYRRLETLIVSGLKTAGWAEAEGSDASIFLWLKLPEQMRHAHMDSRAFSLALAYEGIITYPDHMFGGDGSHVRLCMKGTDSQIHHACEKIGNFLRARS